MNQKIMLLLSLLVAVAVGIGAYQYGVAVGTKNAEMAAQKQTTDAAAQAANPFQTQNPLSGVKINPFK